MFQRLDGSFFRCWHCSSPEEGANLFLFGVVRRASYTAFLSYLLLLRECVPIQQLVVAYDVVYMFMSIEIGDADHERGRVCS